ncbi:Protein translation elongation factor G (EF-G) [Enterococcus faecalis CBRD01]|nr:Protein translation elongation factor G (EF-G) [Enterococcus faecalis CBRD01]
MAAESQFTIDLNKERSKHTKWQENFHLKKLVTLVSWPTLMLVKQQQLSVSCTTLVKSIKSVKPMKVLHKWTGWNKNKNVVSRLHPLRQLHSGKATV